jgi:uncharacterized protein (DUF302 family)
MADTMANEITTKVSPRSVSETVSRFTGILEAKGLKVFDVIDQKAAAKQVGMDMRETTLVLFGNPAAGTPVMVAAPMSARVSHAVAAVGCVLVCALMAIYLAANIK